MLLRKFHVTEPIILQRFVGTEISKRMAYFDHLQSAVHIATCPGFSVDSISDENGKCKYKSYPIKAPCYLQKETLSSHQVICLPLCRGQIV